MTKEGNIQVEVKLYASHQTGRFKKALREYPVGTCIGSGMNQLGIDENAPGIALVNGQRAPLNQLLRDGDTLTLYPLIAGG